MFVRKLSWSHTFSICDGEEACGLSCSFEGAPRKEGDRWSVHKGKLVPCLDNGKAVVKVYQGQYPRPSSKEVTAEMKKHKFAADVLGHCPAVGKTVNLARTWEVKVRKVGKGSKLAAKLGNGGPSGHCLCEDDPVVVQDFVAGDIEEVFSLKHSQTGTSARSEPLLELVRESYRHSRGQSVIGAMKGVAVTDRKTGVVTYCLTSLTIHSRVQEFGEKDMGIQGVTLYEDWSGRSARLPATAPPLEDVKDCEESRQPESECSLKMSYPGNVTPKPPPSYSSISASRLSGSEPPPSYSSIFRPHDCLGVSQADRPLAKMFSVDSQDKDCLRALTAEFVRNPELRHEYLEMILNAMLGPAPAYSCGDYDPS